MKLEIKKNILNFRDVLIVIHIKNHILEFTDGTKHYLEDRKSLLLGNKITFLIS